MTKKAKFGALLLALSVTAAACGSDDPEETATTTEAPADETADESTDEAMEDDEAMEEELPATVVDIAVEAGSFTTLLAAAESAGLVGALSAEGPITVFAPSDEAFEAALAALDITAEELLADTDTLTSILTYHVVEGKVLSTDLSDGMTAPTLNGAEITVTIDGSTVMIDEATVTTADLEAVNGVVHVIDSVLLP